MKIFKMTDYLALMTKQATERLKGKIIKTFYEWMNELRAVVVSATSGK